MKLKCDFCEWHCELSRGGGVCGRYHEQKGRIVELQPFCWVDFYPYSVESMPFYHALPGESIIQTGTVSCNARCCYCINSHLAIDKNATLHLKPKSAEQLVELVQRTGMSGVVFAINEVTCYLPSALAVAELLHQRNLKCGCLTNGFQTEQTAHLLAENMDFINVSLKSLSDDFYRQSLGLPSVQPVLRNIRIFNERTHLEIVTPLVREVAAGEVYDIMDFLYEVNPELVWHLFRLMPNFDRAAERDLSYEAMLQIYRTARQKLPFTYLGNFAGSQWIDTVCPICGELLIKRISTGAWFGGTVENRLTDGKCPRCGKKIPGVF